MSDLFVEDLNDPVCKIKIEFPPFSIELQSRIFLSQFISK